MKQAHLVEEDSTPARVGQTKQEREEKIAKARLELEGMRAERETLSRKVALLRSEAIDPDLLGIQARKMLNTSHPDELIVYFPNAK